MIYRVSGCSFAWGVGAANGRILNVSDTHRNYSSDSVVADPREWMPELYVDRYGRWASIIGNTSDSAILYYPVPCEDLESRVLRYSVHTASLFHTSMADTTLTYSYSAWLTIGRANGDGNQARKVEQAHFSRYLDVSDFLLDLHSADNARFNPSDETEIAVLGKGLGYNWQDLSARGLYMDYASESDSGTDKNRGVIIDPTKTAHLAVCINKAQYPLMETRILWVEFDMEIG